jgi:uncharacterized membrane protein YeaQ/YmgE (transglycosylase-associated protein family)
MSIFGILILLVVAAICGSIGQSIAGYSSRGCIASIVIGYLGAFLGSWIAEELKLPEVFAITIEGEIFPVFWAIVGSMVFAVVLGILTRGNSKKKDND